ncbi:hypothetical protein [Acinetobacter terrae]|uniref:Uncharacterized protein n=1 Tax=Acinetobacter terrae TaxID=2731247 RepID=A0ABX1V8T5_9GAMM|nr:hypothetical protein [Acinetobacter terrae]NNH88974.1 hypothetical protein [Acinetobacter terrae]
MPSLNTNQNLLLFAKDMRSCPIFAEASMWQMLRAKHLMDMKCHSAM